MQLNYYPKHQTGESLASLMLRSASSQFMTPGSLLAKLGTRRPLQAEYQFALQGKSKAINSALSRSEWQQNALQSSLAAKNGFSNWIDFQKTSMCPFCARKGYTPATHDFKLMRTCAEHKVRLTTHCVQCGQTVTANRPWLDRCRCGTPFKVLRTAKEREVYEATLLERWFHESKLELLQAYSECLTLLVDRYGFRAYDPKLIEQLLSGDKTAFFPLLHRLTARFPLLPIRVLLAPMTCAKSPILKAISHQTLDTYTPKPVNKKRKFDKPFWLNLKEFRFALGLQTRLTRTIEAQFFGIRSHQGPSKCCFTHLQLIEFYQHFKNTENVTGPISSLTEISATKKEPIDRLLLKITGGEFSVASYDGKRPLDQLHIYTIAPTNKTVPRGYLTIKEAALYLNTSWEIIRNLRIHGFLPAIHQKNFNNRYLILKSDIEAFHRQYVTMNELCRQLGSSERTLLTQLISATIKPVSGPCVDGNVTYIFARNLIKTIDFESLKFTQPQRSKNDSDLFDSSQWVTAEETARQLGIPVEHIGNFAEPELLISTQANNRSDGEKLYRIDTISRTHTFLKRLVRVDDLAQELNTPTADLLRRFKYLLKARTYYLYGQSFFSTSQVQSLREHYQNYWDAKVSAEYIGCTRGQILAWRRLGLLDAVDYSDTGFIHSPLLFKATTIRSLLYQFVTEQGIQHEKTVYPNGKSR